jgi:hypothetical protein
MRKQARSRPPCILVNDSAAAPAIRIIRAAFQENVPTMTARPIRWILSLSLLSLLAGTVLAGVSPLALGSLSVSTAQVGVPYTSTLQVSGGISPYSYSITAGSLPVGLDFSPKTPTSGAITFSGTPTTPGTYNFTVSVTDSAGLPGYRSRALSGNPAASSSNAFAISVAGGAGGAAGAPTSPWTLALMMMGLAGAGFFGLRQTRRA